MLCRCSPWPRSVFVISCLRRRTFVLAGFSIDDSSLWLRWRSIVIVGACLHFMPAPRSTTYCNRLETAIPPATPQNPAAHPFYSLPGLGLPPSTPKFWGSSFSSTFHVQYLVRLFALIATVFFRFSPSTFQSELSFVTCSRSPFVRARTVQPIFCAWLSAFSGTRFCADDQKGICRNASFFLTEGFENPSPTSNERTQACSYA